MAFRKVASSVLASLVPAGLAMALSFPLEWNETYDAAVPYEVEVIPAKIGLPEGQEFTVLADGKEVAVDRLYGKREGSVRLRFSVPAGTRTLECSTDSVASVQRRGCTDDVFNGAIASIDGWSFDGGEVVKTGEGVEFVLRNGSHSVAYEAKIPAGCAGKDVQFEIEVENRSRFPSANNIFIDQFAADGRLLPETVCDPRWTSHLRPSGVRQHMLNSGRIHPDADKVRLVITMVAPERKLDEYGNSVSNGVDASARLHLSRLSLRPGSLLPFPKFSDAKFGKGVSGRAGDFALRLGGESCNAAWYQTRSWTSWSKSEARKKYAPELREERLVFFPSGAGTCEAWFRPEWPQAESGVVHLFSGKRSTSRNPEVKSFKEPVFDLAYVPGTGEIRFRRIDINGKLFEGVGKAVIPVGEWTHVAVTWVPGDAAKVWVAGREVLRVGLADFAALDLAGAKYPDDEDVMELYVGADGGMTRCSETMVARKGTPFLNGLVDNWRVSTGVRYSAPFSPERTFAVDADTRALFAFDRSYSGVSGGGFGWIPLTFYSATDRVDHKIMVDGNIVQYYPDDVTDKVNPLLVLDQLNYRKMPTADDFRAARRPKTKTFRVRPGDVMSFDAGVDATPDFVEIANCGTEPLVAPFVVGKGEVDARSYGDIRDSLFADAAVAGRERAIRIFQFMLSSCDYYMTHQATFPLAGGDKCEDVWFQPLDVLNSYCGFECGPLNTMVKNIFVCSGALPASMTQGYAHSFEQVFYDGKNHVFDLSAQKFFPSFDNETEAELGELDDQPGLKTRRYGMTDHFIRNASRVDSAGNPPHTCKLGFTLNPGECFRAWWDNDGEGNDLLCSRHVNSEIAGRVLQDYTDRVHADRNTTRYPVYRSHRYFPQYGNGFFVFDGRPNAVNPAFLECGDGFAYHVHSPYPIVAAEYLAVRKDGSEASLEMSTDGGKSYRPLPSGFLRYEVRARHDFLVRVCAPMHEIERFCASTEVQLNSRVLPGRTRPGRNNFVFKGSGGAADVTFAWREPDGEIEVKGALHSGTIPGSGNSLIVCDPSEGPLLLPVSGVADTATARAAGRNSSDISVSVSNKCLRVSAKPGAKGLYALVVDDCGREKAFDLLVCEGARVVRAEDFTLGADVSFVPSGGDLVQNALVFKKPRAKATAKCATIQGRFAVMPLLRVAAGDTERRLAPRIKIEVGGATLMCGYPVNVACNYFKAMYGEDGGRANWKWDFPIAKESRYWLSQMRTPTLSAGNDMTVSFASWGAPRQGEEVELAAVLLVPSPDWELQGDLIKVLCGLNTQRGRVR